MRGALLTVVLLLGTGCGPKPIYRNEPMPPERRPETAPPAVITRTRVEEVVRAWLGVPYRYGGQDRRGIDCSALSQQVLGDLGVSLPRSVRDQTMQGRTVSRSEIAPGDLVFFRLGSTWPDHVGIALDHDHFAHASTSRGVVIDRLMDPYFARRIAEIRRVFPD